MLTVTVRVYPTTFSADAVGFRLLASRTITPARRAGCPSLVFQPRPDLSGFQEAAAAAFGVAVFFGVWFALAAEFFHTRTDRRKVVGSAGSGHVSSIWLERASAGRAAVC